MVVIDIPAHVCRAANSACVALGGEHGIEFFGREPVELKALQFTVALDVRSTLNRVAGFTHRLDATDAVSDLDSLASIEVA